eukprot:COSAG01_NODE_5125_length_4470_cov_2.390300_2_plen_144_part_00
MAMAGRAPMMAAAAAGRDDDASTPTPRRRWHVAIAGVRSENSSFSPLRTRLEDFRPERCARGNLSRAIATLLIDTLLTTSPLTHAEWVWLSDPCVGGACARGVESLRQVWGRHLSAGAGQRLDLAETQVRSRACVRWLFRRCL